MGQIFRRILRIANSYKNSLGSDSYTHLLDDEEQRLREAIDSLGSDNDNASSDDHQRRKANDGSRTGGGSDGMTIQSACAILGVPESAPPEAIKAAYKRLIKEYHPDRVASLGKDVQSLAQRKSRQINGAYQFLKSKRNFK